MKNLLFISDLYNKFNISQTSQILISLCLMLLSGFLVTRITKRLKLPNVTGFIVAGILIGPSVMGLVPQELVSSMSFVSDIAMCFIAFGVGKFFTTQVIKNEGKKALLITLIEMAITGLVMVIVLKFIFNMSWTFVILLSIIAVATAPASTMMIVQQYKAKGEFVETLLQVIAFGNVICLLAFGIVTSIISSTSIGSISALDIALPIIYNIGSMLIGFIFGIILGKLLSVPTRSYDNRLILLISMLLALAGLCALVDISPHIACMVFGATYINYTKDKKLYKELSAFTPPVMSLFFVLGGMSLNLSSLASVGIIGVVYTIVRIITKYFGAKVGAVAVKASNEKKKYLGLGLIPQAGISIGLAFLAQRILPGSIGNTLMTIILASGVLYELIGPACAKASLVLSGSIKKELKEAPPVKDTSLMPITQLSDILPNQECIEELKCLKVTPKDCDNDINNNPKT